MRHQFQKGEPRPAKAGRRAGTPNKSTQSIGLFCREVLETPQFQEKWKNYFLAVPLEAMDPRLLLIAFSYAYGRPRERVELTGAEGGPPEPQVQFYLPSNERHANQP